MEIIKSKRVSKCRMCGNKIDQKYKVMIKNWETKYYYHLSCYLNYLKKELNRIKGDIKKFSKQKFKKTMILERL